MVIIYKRMPDGTVHYLTLNSVEMWNGLLDNAVEFHQSIASGIVNNAQLKYPDDKVGWTVK